MIVGETRIDGLLTIDPKEIPDHRGYFLRTFCAGVFERNGLNTNWPQTNLSRTMAKGMLRGMHFQKEPSPEIKLIQCVTGRIHDVIVDVRSDSPTFGQWEAFDLSEENHRMLYVPGGLAHGFQCQEDDCRVSYMMSAPYDPSLAAGIRWSDPLLAIEWPLRDPVVSERDAALPLLADLALS